MDIQLAKLKSQGDNAKCFCNTTSQIRKIFSEILGSSIDIGSSRVAPALIGRTHALIKFGRSFAKILSAIMSICLRSLGPRSKTMYCAFLEISGLNFPFGNIFCSNNITLALRCLPCVNCLDSTGISVACDIKSSNTSTLFNFGLISLRSSLRVGNP